MIPRIFLPYTVENQVMHCNDFFQYCLLLTPPYLIAHIYSMHKIEVCLHINMNIYIGNNGI